ncbi:hypothetical protein F4821DRAFT_59987 [Hypoxylon rubiginosum]|uniref:Uncharacterized protein n=1 Tax=Hypoxylon rubiginosum TaxID=110542 RepID=A0ACC0DA22_9PEZI|nr:hypothetical protein F4821DRAFT_59987 [Hypoxylon rubiginosum]
MWLVGWWKPTATVIMPRCTLCNKTYSEGTLRDHKASSHLGVVCHFPGNNYANLPNEDDDEMTKRLLAINRQHGGGGGESGNRFYCCWPNCGHKKEDFVSEKNLGRHLATQQRHAGVRLGTVRLYPDQIPTSLNVPNAGPAGPQNSAGAMGEMDVDGKEEE